MVTTIVRSDVFPTFIGDVPKDFEMDGGWSTNGTRPLNGSAGDRILAMKLSERVCGPVSELFWLLAETRSNASEAPMVRITLTKTIKTKRLLWRPLVL